MSKADYQKLKELAAERERTQPGDTLALYYLGMAHFRCQEYVNAKRCFEALVKLDASWKKVSTNHLAEIEANLKKMKPTLVDNER